MTQISRIRAAAQARLPQSTKELLKSIFDLDSTKSYSQFGEDVYVNSYFMAKSWKHGAPMQLPSSGFYVDVGAYSPTSCSNTHSFYKRGWRGINVDATPGVKRSFDLVRKKDINLNVAIGTAAGMVDFYCWGYPSVFNTSDPVVAHERTISLGQKPDLISVECITLATLLERHASTDEPFRFLSVDVEGRDLDVLKSNDWHAYRPELVIAESYSDSLGEVAISPILQFLAGQDYKLIAWLQPSLVFADARCQPNK